MATTEENWSLVEARRDDGTPAMFRIRDLAPRADQPRIFVVEMPYPVNGLSRLPDAAAYRRLTAFEEQWLVPACSALDYTFVAAKTEDGSFFLYLYGASDPTAMIEKLSPFDGSLGFFEEHDPQWEEYAALRELLDQANAMPDHDHDDHDGHDHADHDGHDHSGHDHAADDHADEHTGLEHAPAPARKRPAKKSAAATAAGKTPAGKTPASKTPAGKTPASKKPAGKTPAPKKPASKKPASKKPASKKPASKKPASKKPASKKPASKRSAPKK